MQWHRRICLPVALTIVMLVGALAASAAWSETGRTIRLILPFPPGGPADVMAALAAGRPVEPGTYYFRGATFFETSAAQYLWLTNHIIICTGHREAAMVTVRFYKVL